MFYVGMRVKIKSNPPSGNRWGGDLTLGGTAGVKGTVSHISFNDYNKITIVVDGRQMSNVYDLDQVEPPFTIPRPLLVDMVIINGVIL